VKPADQPAFVALLTGVCAYYRQDASDFTLGLWWEACQGFDLAEVSRALNAHAMNPDVGQFAPKVADVVKQLQGTTADQAALAWAKVMRAVSSAGCYADVAFDDPLIHVVLSELGGWPKLCHTKAEELDFTRSTFVKRYRGLTLQRPTTWPDRLMGLANAHNASKGLPLEPVALVGDKAKALRVMERGSDKPMIAVGYTAAAAAERALPAPQVPA
jgi:uncharacterized protein DUF6475